MPTIYFFGFRPRDDQSASLGHETRTMFELLNAAGSYPSSGRFPGVNDNPTYVSRTTDYLATAFPNGATMIVRHYRTHEENDRSTPRERYIPLTIGRIDPD